MNIYEIIEKFEIGNSKKNKLLACLIKNSAIYYKRGLKDIMLDLYGFDDRYTLEFFIKKIIETDDTVLIDICIKSIQTCQMDKLIKRYKITV